MFVMWNSNKMTHTEGLCCWCACMASACASFCCCDFVHLTVGSVCKCGVCVCVCLCVCMCVSVSVCEEEFNHVSSYPSLFYAITYFKTNQGSLCVQRWYPVMCCSVYVITLATRFTKAVCMQNSQFKTVYGILSKDISAHCLI